MMRRREVITLIGGGRWDGDARAACAEAYVGDRVSASSLMEDGHHFCL
jgi:hypothetical protein